MPRPRKRDLIEDFLMTEKLRDGQRRIFVKLEIEFRDVQSGEINSVINPVVVRIV